MDRYYVELAMPKGVFPVATLAPNTEKSVEDTVSRYHHKFIARYAVVLSPEVTHLFGLVDKWETGNVIISPEIFRVTLATLLKEGRFIADRQWRDRFHVLISPKAEYAGITTDDMAELMNCPLVEIGGLTYYSFDKEEALAFMALVIREGIARRLKELLQTN